MSRFTFSPQSVDSYLESAQAASADPGRPSFVTSTSWRTAGGEPVHYRVVGGGGGIGDRSPSTNSDVFPTPPLSSSSSSSSSDYHNMDGIRQRHRRQAQEQEHRSRQTLKSLGVSDHVTNDAGLFGATRTNVGRNDATGASRLIRSHHKDDDDDNDVRVSMTDRRLQHTGGRGGGGGGAADPLHHRLGTITSGGEYYFETGGRVGEMMSPASASPPSFIGSSNLQHHRHHIESQRSGGGLHSTEIVAANSRRLLGSAEVVPANQRRGMSSQTSSMTSSSTMIQVERYEEASETVALSPSSTPSLVSPRRLERLQFTHPDVLSPSTPSSATSTSFQRRVLSYTGTPPNCGPAELFR